MHGIALPDSGGDDDSQERSDNSDGESTHAPTDAQMAGPSDVDLFASDVEDDWTAEELHALRCRGPSCRFCRCVLQKC